MTLARDQLPANSTGAGQLVQGIKPWSQINPMLIIQSILEFTHGDGVVMLKQQNVIKTEAMHTVC